MMKLRVLGCYGGDYKARFPAFLIDDIVLIDAGTIGAALSLEQQLKIKTILISHHHIDHLLALPFFADAIYDHHDHSVHVYGLSDVLNNIKKHLFNNVIWPDFTTLPDNRTPTLTWMPMKLGVSVMVNDSILVTPIPSCHTCQASGFVLKKGKQILIYTGDTGPCDSLWETVQPFVNQSGHSSLVIECSFPNRLEHFALETGHLTPSLLDKELSKADLKDVMIYIFHMKPQHIDEIKAEIGAMTDYSIRLMMPDDEYILGQT